MESAERHPFAVSDIGARSWAAMTAVSFFCHLAFFAMMHVLPGLRPEKQSALPPVVNVTMVSLPEAEAPLSTPEAADTGRTPKPLPAPEKAVESKTPPAPVEKTPPPPQVKRSMKKKTYRSSKVVESALSRIEEKVEEKVEQEARSRPDPLQEALDRLAKAVESRPEAGRAQPRRQEKKAAAGPGLVGGGTEGIRKELELIDIYRMEIAWRVQKNWAFPDSLAGNDAQLVVELAFTVLPNGEIRDVWFDKRSGNRYLDESAKRAVLKANPVGPHPKGIAKPTITVGLRFTPEGVK